MATKNFYVKDGLKVKGNTLLNGANYSDTPLSKLHVKSAANGAGSNLNNVNGLIVENSGSSESNYVLKLATGAGNVFNITNAGSVGIGITNPGETLTVVGDISASGNIYGNIADLEFTDLTVTGDLSVAGDSTFAALTASTICNTGDITVTGDVEADEFIGALRGAVSFTALAGEALSKGDVVYISGLNGNTTVVSKADANDPNKMPAFGLAETSASINSAVTIYTFGTLSNLNTNGWPTGAELFVGTTAGQMVTAAPTGECAQIQKVGKVTRGLSSSAGSIKVQGPGRSNATPNLNEGRLFVGNSSNQAVADGTIHVDIANSRVGIGTTSPGTKLQIDSGSGIGTVDNAYSLAIRGDGIDGIQILSDSAYSGRIVFGDQNSNNSGQVRYDHSTDAFRFFTNGTEKVSILSGGNVGIGTTSPSSKLHVSGSALANTLYAGSSTSAAIVIDSSTIYRPNSFFQIIGGGGQTTRNNIKFTNGAGLVIDGGSGETAGVEIKGGGGDVKFTQGNVGIGTTDPNQKLEVFGNQRISNSGVLEFFGGTVYPQISRNGTSGGLIIDTAGGGVSNSVPLLSVRENGGTDFVTVLGSGNVGIGTTSPEAKLHIASGDVLISNNQFYSAESLVGTNYKIAGITNGNMVQVGAIDYTSAGTIFAGGSNVSITTGGASGTSRLYINSSGNVGIGTTSPNAKLSIKGDTEFLDENTGVRIGLLYDNGTEGILDLRDNNVTKVNLRTAGASYFTGGNVGIGITDPNEKLTVTGNISASGCFISCGSATQNQLEFKSSANGQITLKAGSSNGSGFLLLTRCHASNASIIETYLTSEGSADSYIGSSSSSLGNFGIGTASPNEKLTVSGNISASGTVYADAFSSVTGGDTIDFNDNLHLDGNLTVNGTISGNDVFTIGGGGTSSGGMKSLPGGGTDIYALKLARSSTARSGPDIWDASSDSIIIGTTSSDTTFTVTSGAVGIGTTNPNHNLSVDGTVGGTLYSSSYIEFPASGGDAGNTIIKANDDVKIGFCQDVVVKQSGNVGIGITDPDEKLEVDGNIKISAGKFYRMAGNAFQIGIDGSAVGMRFYADSTERMTILSGGNVGIGTSTPGSTLDVNGTLKVQNNNSSSNYMEFTAPGSWNVVGSRPVIKVGGTEKMRASANGVNIGGSTDATHTLDVDGAAHFSSDVTIEGTVLHCGDLTVNGDLTVQGTTTTLNTEVCTTSAMEITNAGTGPALVVNQTGSQPVIDFQDDGTSTFYIEDGGNVGIGTTNPDRKLHVHDGDVIIHSGTGVNTYNDLSIGGINGWSNGEAHRINFVYGANGNNIFQTIEGYYNSANVGESKLRFRNLYNGSANTDISVTILGNGNVGIGDDQPSNKLVVVNSDTDTTPTALLQNSSTGDASLHFNVSGRSYTIGIDNSDDDKFKISRNNGLGTTDRLTIDGDGDVGIGTTNPTEVLHIVRDSDAGVGIEVDNGSTGTNGHSRISLENNLDDRFFLINHGSGRTTVTRYGIAVGSYSEILAQESVNGLLIGTGQTNTPIIFGNNNGERMRIAAGGNVGINTTSPSVALDVVGSFKASSSATLGDDLLIGPTTTPDIVLQSSGSGVNTNGKLYWKDSGGTVRASAGYETGSTEFFIDNTFSGGLYLKSNGTVGLTVNSAANVGIGTTSPAKKLHVTGDTLLESTNSGSAATLSESATVYGLKVRGAASSGSLNFSSNNARYTLQALSSGNGAINLTLNPFGGNVGIGTASPSNILHIKNANPVIRLEDSSPDGVYGLIDAAGGDFIISADGGAGSADSFISFRVDGTAVGSEKMRITSGGNVGIGTTGPGSTRLRVVNGSSGQEIFKADDGATAVIRAKVDGTVTFEKGNVGIGTTSPDVKLQIEDSAAGSNVDVLQLTNTSTDADSSVGVQFFSGNAQFAYIRGIRTSSSSEGILKLGVRSGGSETDTLFLKGGSVGIGTTDFGTNTGKLFVGGYCADGSSAIAQFNGFIRADRVITHTAAGAAIAPNVDTCGTIGTASARFANVYAVCTTTGAVIESNLCSEGIDSCPQGSVVVWRDGKLQGTTQEYDYSVMGVTTPGTDSPIVMGAEPILVTGDIKEGDPIVTSSKLNHGMKGDRSCDLHGKVIAQALEDGSGESYIIQGMIRKF